MSDVPAIWLNETELKVLAFLHERATGYDRFHCVHAKDQNGLAKEIGCDNAAFAKAVSYLGSWNMVGDLDRHARDPATKEKFRRMGGGAIHSLWLTGDGEAYMRALEAQLERDTLLAKGKTLTLGALAQVWAAARDAVAQTAGVVLAEYVKQHGISPTS
jgi:hypothetical protein